MYTVGKVTDNHRFTFKSETSGIKPMDLAMEDMFGSSPKIVMEDKTIDRKYAALDYDFLNINNYLEQVLQLEQCV